MGITGELVRSVFSKSRSIRTHETNVRSNSERRWKSSVRSYLCGDKFNSVLAEEDSASVRSSIVTVSSQPEFSSVYAEEDPVSSVWSSEATVKQPVTPDLIDEVDVESEQKNRDMQEEQNTTSRLVRKDDATIIIQSAFRSFLARRRMEGLHLMDGNDELDVGAECRRSDSVGTSVEVKTGNSTGVHSFRDKNGSIPQPVQLKGRPQVLKLKEDWDDSTVSSNISKLRMQNRLEATTRRERALAYAFSQQSVQRRNIADPDRMLWNLTWAGVGLNVGWQLARQQENCLLDITKQYEPLNQKSAAMKRLSFDVPGEEESCGSNEVSIQLDNISASAFLKEKADNIKADKCFISRCKTMPS